MHFMHYITEQGLLTYLLCTGKLRLANKHVTSFSHSFSNKEVQSTCIFLHHPHYLSAEHTICIAAHTFCDERANFANILSLHKRERDCLLAGQTG